MKLHCHRPSLLAAFQVVHGVVPARTPKEILRNVLIDVADGQACLIGTDQEVGIRFDITGVETDSNGHALLPTNHVMSILRELTDDSVDLELSTESIQIRSGHSQFRLSAMDAAEFPLVPVFPDEQHLAVSADAFAEMIRRTIFASDSESSRYALGGILLELNPEKITFAATDSRRLAVVTSGCEMTGGSEILNTTPVVPAKAMSLIERSLSDTDEKVLIASHSNDLLLKTPSSTVYCRLVEGSFPKYKDVIPSESQYRIDFVVGPLYSAVRQAQIVTNEESRGVDFTFQDGKLILSSQAVDVGQSTIELPITFDQEPITITFDPRYLSDFLRVLDSGHQIRMEMLNADSAAVFRTEDNYTYVIMPLSRDR